jgi:hypothetical protein
MLRHAEGRIFRVLPWGVMRWKRICFTNAPGDRIPPDHVELCVQEQCAPALV